MRSKGSQHFRTRLVIGQRQRRLYRFLFEIRRQILNQTGPPVESKIGILIFFDDVNQSSALIWRQVGSEGAVGRISKLMVGKSIGNQNRVAQQRLTQIWGTTASCCSESLGAKSINASIR